MKKCARCGRLRTDFHPDQPRLCLTCWAATAGADYLEAQPASRDRLPNERLGAGWEASLRAVVGGPPC